MDIILLKDLDSLGYKHDIVSVKSGYGRNFLIPQGIGVIANQTNKEKLEKILEAEEAKEAARVEEYKTMAEQISGKTINIGVKSGTSGKIFGSVTNVQIAAALKEQLDVDIERKKIEIVEDIKELGTYTALVKFYKEVEASVNFELIKE